MPNLIDSLDFTISNGTNYNLEKVLNNIDFWMKKSPPYGMIPAGAAYRSLGDYGDYKAALEFMAGGYGASYLTLGVGASYHSDISVSSLAPGVHKQITGTQYKYIIWSFPTSPNWRFPDNRSGGIVFQVGRSQGGQNVWEESYKITDVSFAVLTPVANGYDILYW